MLPSYACYRELCTKYGNNNEIKQGTEADRPSVKPVVMLSHSLTSDKKPTESLRRSLALFRW